MRNECINKLNNVVKNKKLSKNVENSIYHHYGTNIHQYRDKFVSLYLNLNPKSIIGNKTFVKRLKKKEINVSDIAIIKPAEIFPEYWSDIMNKRKLQEDFLYSKRPESYSTLYTCGRCKNKKVSYYELQTRSADEGMTTFYRCIECNNKWKN